jgi:hypothetical protein
VVVLVMEVEAEVEVDVELCGSGTGSEYLGEAGREKSRCLSCLPISDCAYFIGRLAKCLNSVDQCLDNGYG